MAGPEKKKQKPKPPPDVEITKESREAEKLAKETQEEIVKRAVEKKSFEDRPRKGA